MSLDIKTSLDTVKRQALLTILKNVKVPYTDLNNDLYIYLSTDSSAFNALLSRFKFNAAVFSSTQVSAVWLLSYLDFYALYTLMVSNYEVFNTLKTISEGKYKYIYNLYKDLNRVVETKRILQDYSFGFYNNFLHPKDINAAASRVVTRSGKLTNVLESFPVVTLPVKTSKEVLPTALTFFTDDQAISDIETSSDTDFLNYSILRYQNNKVSVVKSIEPAKDGIIYSRSIPDVSGTIAGYFTDAIYITVTESSRDSADNAIFKIQGSTNSIDWSSDLTVAPAVPTRMTIEGDIEIGLSITLYDGCSLAVGDRWVLNIRHMDVAPPSIELAIRFGMLEPISFISYLDTSSHKIDVISSKVQRRKFNNTLEQVNLFDGNIGHIAIVNGQVNTYKTKFIQSNSDISSKDGKLANKYDFKIADIKGYQRTYESHGAITFNAVPVSGVTSAAVEAQTFLPGYGIWESESNLDVQLPQSFIEFNVTAETILSSATIPLLPKNYLKKIIAKKVLLYSDLLTSPGDPGDFIIVTDDATQNLRGTYVLTEALDWKKYSQNTTGYYPVVMEAIVPNRVDITNELLDYGAVLYNPRFPVDLDYALNSASPYPYIQAYDNSLKSETSYSFNTDNGTIRLSEYYWKNGYSVVYPVKLYSISDTFDNTYNNGKWIAASSSIYYLYYFDEYNDVHLALREYDPATSLLKPISGNLFGQIEIRSMDKPYITPMVFDYKLEYI